MARIPLNALRVLLANRTRFRIGRVRCAHQLTPLSNRIGLFQCQHDHRAGGHESGQRIKKRLSHVNCIKRGRLGFLQVKHLQSDDAKPISFDRGDNIAGCSLCYGVGLHNSKRTL